MDLLTGSVLVVIFIALPVAAIYSAATIGSPHDSKPLTIEEMYPDEHLGIG